MNEQNNRITYLNKEGAEALVKNNIVDGVLRIPDTITVIGDYAFSEIKFADAPIHLIIPKSLILIKKYAFQYCKCFKSVTFETSSLPVIMEDAVFNRNSTIESVQFDKVILGESTFDTCINLKTVIFNGVVPSIPAFCFRGTESLEHISFPEGLIEIMGHAFEDSGVEVDYFPKTLMKIGRNAFHRTNIKCVKLQSHVNICQGAFQSCYNLSEVHFEYLKTIEKSAFANCFNLVKVEIANTDEGGISIGTEAFRDCQKLENFTVANGFIKDLGISTFWYCENLKSIDVSKVEAISPSCFLHCLALEEIDCSSAKEIDGDAFSNCKSLKRIKLSKNLAFIGPGAFTECVMLSSITLPNSLIDLRHGAFNSCKKLKSITIPRNLKNIESETFYHCDSLKSVKFAKNSVVEKIGQSAFAECVSLEKIILPENLTRIDIYAFSRCINLKSVQVGKKLKQIDACAFFVCESLETIELPVTLTTMGNRVFDNCSNLKSVIFEGKLPSFDGDPFAGCDLLEEIKILNLTDKQDS